MENYKIILQNNIDTVVSKYVPLKKKITAFQTEAQLEKQLIDQLVSQSYEYLKIHTEDELKNNLRKQIEKLNKIFFTDSEWERYSIDRIFNANNSIKEKTEIVQENSSSYFKFDNGKELNIKLIDKENLNNNSLQVINQYEANEGRNKNRYDVTILVNGLPMVHIELKRRGVSLKDAFNQINRYQHDSFWSGCGLFQFIQIFVISNGTLTKYYSNTTRQAHIKESKDHCQTTSASFDFTSFWADSENKIIPDLIDFAQTFFNKNTLLNVLYRYCVFTVDKDLLVMRPYQIVATERILKKIEIAHNYKQYGSINAGGYIWHSTGSGKTLTSYKTARLASNLPYIDKVIFVVDRQDLDYQTMKEYNKFEQGAVNSNKSTDILRKQLEGKGDANELDTKYKNIKIVVTTIQKLSNLVNQYPKLDIYSKQIVFMFDECHRSQFGKMRDDIVKKFKYYYIFGFTGTPIFAKNSSSANNPKHRTTQQQFGEKLHSYTINDAINDKNVLPFKVDFVGSAHLINDDDTKDDKVEGIDDEKAYLDKDRISKIVSYILSHYDYKTYTNTQAKLYSTSFIKDVSAVIKSKDPAEEEAKQREKRTLKGFNSILATSSIDAAKIYYSEFKKQQKNLLDKDKKKIALIYSYATNNDSNDDENIEGFIDEENSDSTDSLSKPDRDFLEDAMIDYDNMFHTGFSNSLDQFSNYYKDVSLRVKNKEIDILIVVNMFLTGFDAPKLNTLWIDKNLFYHGLIQTFSRTNRIFNSIKNFGNVICFRNIKENMDKAISLFSDGNDDDKGIVRIRTFNEYYNGYEQDGKKIKGYTQLVNDLTTKFPQSLNLQCFSIDQKKEFISIFSSLLRVINILLTFDEFKNEKILLSDYQMQNYQSIYIELHDEFENQKDLININEDIEFEMELIQSIEINIDYILSLIEKYKKDNAKDKDINLIIETAIDSSTELKSKKELILKFLNLYNIDNDIYGSWLSYVKDEKKKDLLKIIEEENLKQEETIKFMDTCFNDGYLKVDGTEIVDILPLVSHFTKNNNYSEMKNRVIYKLQKYFDKYYSLS